MERFARLRHFAAVLGLAALLSVAPSHEAVAEETNSTTSLVLSLLFPGVGEWYNAGFIGGFPLVECITGRLCPCIGMASIIDAAAGRTDDGIRFDFWASPVSKPKK